MTTTLIEQNTEPKEQIPKSLIYEVLNGRPLYRKGYREVLKKKLNPENVMGSSSLQAILVTFLSNYLFNNLNDNYVVVSNEAGLHIELNENLSNDIAIYWADDIEVIDEKYFNIPPRIVVEVDVQIDLNEFTTESEYIFEKTNRLLDFGVEKVIWILTKFRKIIVIEKSNQNWTEKNWLQEIEITSDCKFILNELLKTKRITKQFAV
jgi:hypothetical protein